MISRSAQSAAKSENQMTEKAEVNNGENVTETVTENAALETGMTQGTTESGKKNATESAPKEVAKPIPLFDGPAELKPLDRVDPIWVTSDRKNVVLVGNIAIREGLLEFFACRTRSKEHESIVVLNVKPYLIHAALLVIGAKKGQPAKFDPKFEPPTGEEIEIHVRWKEADGTVCDITAQEMIREADSRKPMTVPWVFTGGLTGKDENGHPYYLADITGEIFGVSNFAGSILDVPMESSSSNDHLYYEPNTEMIPDVGTEVTLILSRKNP